MKMGTGIRVVRSVGRSKRKVEVTPWKKRENLIWLCRSVCDCDCAPLSLLYHCLCITHYCGFRRGGGFSSIAHPSGVSGSKCSLEMAQIAGSPDVKSQDVNEKRKEYGIMEEWTDRRPMVSILSILSILCKVCSDFSSVEVCCVRNVTYGKVKYLSPGMV